MRKIESFIENKETFVSFCYEKLNDNKLLCKTVKPFFSNSDKIVGYNEIHLTENGELYQNGSKNCKYSKLSCFSNVVQNLDITRYSINKPSLGNIKIQL